VKQTVVISQKSDEQGYFYRAIHLEDDGSLVIEGQDIGSGVGDFFGGENSEYEFFRTVRPQDVARLRRLADVGDANLLDSLRDRFDSTRSLETFLEQHGIESDFWSRVGD